MSRPRTLVVVRHAEAARPVGIADHDRPLSPAGLDEAQSLGRRLGDADLIPDLALVSSALRTRQTWSTMASTWDDTVRERVLLVETRAVYEATVSDLADQIRDCGAESHRVLVCGHEPVLSGLVHRLAGPDSDPVAMAAVADRLRTGAAAVLDVAVAWDQLVTARLTRVLQPRDHPSRA